MEANVRVIAYYLPQFYPTPENDLWWGKGFTEWTNVARAKPLFGGHYQPHIPADLGFYDLRVPETRAAQAELAKNYGIEGFCYWHYWLGCGNKLLERPFEEVLESGDPDFPFCLGWANHSWTGVWSGDPNQKLIEQTYPGSSDHEAHFYYLLTAFQDHRYITVEDKPLLVLFRPYEIPDCQRFTDLWRELARKAGLKGLHIIGLDIQDIDSYGCDAAAFSYNRRIESVRPKSKLEKIYRKVRGQPIKVYLYEDALPYFLDGRESDLKFYPTVVPNWDSTPRLGFRGTVLHKSTPKLFRTHFRAASNMVVNKPFEHRIIFAKSWNEWAEGNHLEPDQKFGKAYLEVIRGELIRSTIS
jgi:thiol-disulfide isomerase/thioredoxin